MPHDGELPAIFNPKRIRTPSVIITGDAAAGGRCTAGANSGLIVNSASYGSIINSAYNTSNPHITHQDSLSSSHHDPSEVVVVQADTTTPANVHQVSFGLTETGITSAVSDHDSPHATDIDNLQDGVTVRFKGVRACKQFCCSELAWKMYYGVCMTTLVTASWVGITHCIKYMSRLPHVAHMERDLSTTSKDTLREFDFATERSLEGLLGRSKEHILINGVDDVTEIFTPPSMIPPAEAEEFRAPFISAWFYSNFSILFFPIYMLASISLRKWNTSTANFSEVMRGLRDRGFSVAHFLNRCFSFCALWLFTIYLYTLSLDVLFATDAIALFSTNVACVYLLSWVVLHEQFVGVRIVAAILCDTGIALLAYMDGITERGTLRGVVLATLAAAGYAVFRVMVRKVMGDPPLGQIAFMFTVLGIFNAFLMWPICLGLYLAGKETVPIERIPWSLVLLTSVLLLIFNILMLFSSAITYNMFVTLGLITAVPVSGALDVIFYSTTFAGMKLAGIILIAIGFLLVMLPGNWPDYITKLLRWGRGHRSGTLIGQHPNIIDYRTGYIKSHLRSPSGRVR